MALIQTQPTVIALSALKANKLCPRALKSDQKGTKHPAMQKECCCHFCWGWTFLLSKWTEGTSKTRQDNEKCWELRLSDSRAFCTKGRHATRFQIRPLSLTGEARNPFLHAPLLYLGHHEPGKACSLLVLLKKKRKVPSCKICSWLRKPGTTEHCCMYAVHLTTAKAILQ